MKPLRAARRPPEENTCALLGTSMRYQGEQFFQNSTLHGVRYIREEGRPFLERFLWFCFTSIGAVVTLIIIMSLWDKFQHNPTITGLDTDFHNWDVPFPAVSLCFTNPADEEAINSSSEYSHAMEYIRLVTNFSFPSLSTFLPLLGDNRTADLLSTPDMATLQEQFAKQCPSVFQKCEYKARHLNCCDQFLPLPSEMGWCLSFNSRHAYERLKKGKFMVDHIRETDEKWSLQVTLQAHMKNALWPVLVYIHSHEEVPILDETPQLRWSFRIQKLAFSAKQTYTTEDARQLSIRQRRCVFPDEISLETDSIYTYGACMSTCRVRAVKSACHCVPFFYTTTANYTVCGVQHLKCLVDNADRLMSLGQNCSCELGCMNTVYDVEKMHSDQTSNSLSLEVSFVSWPMVRYKREVLFGWVDLLVSFGGIAGLFLGFSLLSGVEVIYYFSLRALCMLRTGKEQLLELQIQRAAQPKPPLDLSLTPYWRHKEQLPVQQVQEVQKLPQYPFEFLP